MRRNTLLVIALLALLILPRVSFAQQPEADADHDAEEHDHDHEEEEKSAESALLGTAVEEDDDHDHGDDHDHEEEEKSAESAVLGTAVEEDDDHNHGDDHDHEEEGEDANSALLGTAKASSHAGHGHGGSCEFEEDENYDIGLAIASVFVLLITSFAGAAFPSLLAIRQHPYLIMAIKLGSFAGTGVLLTVGFVHMLGHANEKLESPCLSEGWLEAYHGWAYLFVVITIVILQAIDYVLTSLLVPLPTAQSEGRFATVNADGGVGALGALGTGHTMTISTNTLVSASAALDSLDVETAGCTTHAKCKDDDCNGRALLPPPGSTDKDVQGSPNAKSLQDESSSAAVSENEHYKPHHAPVKEACNEHATRCKDEECSGRALLPLPAGGRSKALSNLLVSEISICSHSIIIGLALGVTGDGFVPLFIAIIFHQLLEGVALGANAAEAGLSGRYIILQAAIFALTTPVGIAIGIGVRESLNTNSVPMLLTTGIIDSIAAGALIFVALGDHMNACRSQAGWLRAQSMLVQIACFGAFFVGAAALLVIGLWA